jgi:hypothetical protein
MWAKLHTDILDDPKLMSAVRRGRARNLDVLPWLIAFAKRADDAGRLTIAGKPADPDDIARAIPNVTTKRVAGCMRELTRLGVLMRESDRALRFARWQQRAESKPSDSRSAVAKRVQRYRDRRRIEDAAANESAGNALQGVTSNAPVTRQSESKRQRKKKSESGDSPTAAPLAPPAPPVVLPQQRIDEFLATFYGDASPKRRADVLAQLHHGGRLADGVDARPRDSLHALQCLTATLTDRERIHDGDRAIVWYLRKLGDASDAHARDDAMEMFERIRGLIQSNPSPRGVHRFIPRAEVERLGADVLAAYEEVGGAAAFLDTPGEKLPFLRSAFAKALTRRSRMAQTRAAALSS